MTDCKKRLTDRHIDDQHRALRGATRLLAATILALTSSTFAAEAANDVLHTEVTFNISAQPLGASLKQLASQAGVQILFEEQVVSGQQAPALAAHESPLQALSALLKGTGLEFTAKDGTIVVRKKVSGSNPVTSGPTSPTMAAADRAHDGSSGTAVDGRVELEEIVVTAQHRREKLRDVPMGITALSGEYLDQRQDRDFEDYAATVPGLSLTRRDAGFNLLTLRGINANATGSTVSVYVDDSPVGSSSNLAAGSIFASNYDPWDMQRIEVLRGPQGTLYGASSEGGLIKFVTNAPDPNKFASMAEVGGDSIARGGEGWSGKLMVNAPLGSAAALRVSGYSESIPGYIDDPLRHQSDVNSVKRNGYRASLLLLPTSDLTVRLTAFKQEIKTDGSSVVDVDNDTRQPVFGPFTQERATPERSRFTYDHYNATVDWNLGWASALSSTTYGKTNNRFFIDKSMSPLAPGLNYSQAYSAALGTPVGYSLTVQPEVKKLTQELRLQSPSNAWLEWEVGGYFTRETAHLSEPNDLFNLSDGSLFGGQPYILINLDSLYKEWAGFATLTYHINPQVDVQVGGRWAHNDQSFSELLQVNLPSSPAGIIPGAASASRFLYSFAPRWHVTDDLMFYGRIASGYQPGGPNPLQPGTPASVPSQYQPDSTVNYEVGVRNRLFNQRLSIDLTAFRIDWSKVQLATTIQANGNDFTVTGNGGKARSQGLEWALALTPLPDLTLSLTGAYIDAKLTTDAPAVYGVSGQRLPGSPEWNSSLDAEYGHSAFADYRAFVGGTWSYTGTRFTDFSATGTSFAPPTSMPGYTTLNLRAGLQNGRWRFSLYAKNVTSKQALQLFYSSGVTGFPGTGIFVPPREIGGTVSFKF